MNTFSNELLAAFKTQEGLSDVSDLLAIYNDVRLQVPGAPEASELLPKHIKAIREIRTFNIDQDFTWDCFSARMETRAKIEIQWQNPFLPDWNGKTDDKDNVWSSDTGALDFNQQQKLTNLIEAASPPLVRDIYDLLDTAPTSDLASFSLVISAMPAFLSNFLAPMGDGLAHKNEDWRWSKTLAMLGGLGDHALQYLMDEASRRCDDATLHYFAHCTPQQRKDEVLQGREISGYPIGLLRTDCVDVMRILDQCDISQPPRWLYPLILLHILKHVRYYPSVDGHPALMAAYGGRISVSKLDERGSWLALNASENSNTLRSICSTLRISAGGAKKTANEMAVASVMAELWPRQLPRPASANTRSELVIPSGVTFDKTPIRATGENAWINTGITVSGLGKIDIKTGVVNKDAFESGPSVVSIAWPLDYVDNKQLLNWRSCIPEVVKPALPSDMLFKWIKNVNDLGNPEGLKAAIDTVIITDLMREHLAGTPIGNALLQEYPIVIVLPSDSTQETTTNQGKTNTARILAGALVPGIKEMQCSQSASAPAQRTVSMPIEQYGTALYDEFQVPVSPDHFLSHVGLQMLATGGTVSPGRAMENSKGLSLQHPLFLAAKYSTEMEDVLNRQLPIFLNVLTDETKCAEDELSKILSGRAALEVRFAALRYIEENNLIPRAAECNTKNGQWRFNGHLGIADLLGHMPAMLSYLATAREKCISQRNDAMANNLPGQLGLRGTFDARYYFDDACDDTLNQIEAHCKVKGPMRLKDMLVALIENYNKRSLKDELRRFGIEERGLAQKMSEVLKKGSNGRVERDGWALEETFMKSDNGKKVQGVLLKRTASSAIDVMKGS